LDTAENFGVAPSESVAPQDRQGVTTGVLTVAAPNTIALTAASNTAGAAADLATQAIKQQTGLAEQQDVPSLITVEVLGYGGQ
jgi:hypothetical protein